VRQKFADEPLTVHECGGELERLISAPALQFKGTGWYVTDYARGGNSHAASDTNGKSGSKSETKSDTAPAKTDTKSDSKAETKADKK